MLEDLLITFGSKPFRFIFVEQTSDEVLTLGGDSDAMSHRVWELDISLKDKCVHAVAVLMVERGNTDNQLV